MKNFDFNDFLKSVRHFGHKDKIEAAKFKLVELEKNKSGANRKEAQIMAQKINEFLLSL